jgi:hypothetical protein
MILIDAIIDLIQFKRFTALTLWYFPLIFSSAKSIQGSTKIVGYRFVLQQDGVFVAGLKTLNKVSKGGG